MRIDGVSEALLNRNVGMVQQQMNTGMLKKALQSEKLLMAQLLQSMPSMDPDIGQNIDIKA